MDRQVEAAKNGMFTRQTWGGSEGSGETAGTHARSNMKKRLRAITRHVGRESGWEHKNVAPSAESFAASPPSAVARDAASKPMRLRVCCSRPRSLSRASRSAHLERHGEVGGSVFAVLARSGLVSTAVSGPERHVIESPSAGCLWTSIDAESGCDRGCPVPPAPRGGARIQEGQAARDPCRNARGGIVAPAPGGGESPGLDFDEQRRTTGEHCRKGAEQRAVLERRREQCLPYDGRRRRALPRRRARIASSGPPEARRETGPPCGDARVTRDGCLSSARCITGWIAVRCARERARTRADEAMEVMRENTRT